MMKEWADEMKEAHPEWTEGEFRVAAGNRWGSWNRAGGLRNAEQIEALVDYWKRLP